MWDRSPKASDDQANDAAETVPSRDSRSDPSSTSNVASPPPPAPVVSPAYQAPRPASQPRLVSPAPFQSIGTTPPANPLVPPAIPAPAAPILGSPAAPVRAAGAIAQIGGPVIAEPKKRRRWPLLLLALLTILGSGALSWGVATYVNQNDPVETEQVAGAPQESDATAQPAVEDTSTSTAPSPASVRTLDEEPFARAAEIIRPSVVQLNLGQGLGTGVIIDADGTILTAAHVVGNATDLRVTFSDGSSAPGTVVGTHEATDVAVVRVDPAGRTLVAAALAEGDDVRVGQQAVAVGSPFGFDQTVTAGIISAVDRLIPGSSASFVQTDAPINPGNSGGPLINLDGEVVGINDLIFTESGSSAGVGFAISIDLAKIIADQIVAGVEPQVALLGVSTAAPANGARGAQVDTIVPGSAADNAGLQVGDILIELNGVPTRGTGDLRAQVIDQEPGSTVEITILRDGEEVTLNATLGDTPAE